MKKLFIVALVALATTAHAQFTPSVTLGSPSFIGYDSTVQQADIANPNVGDMVKVYWVGAGVSDTTLLAYGVWNNQPVHVHSLSDYTTYTGKVCAKSVLYGLLGCSANGTFTTLHIPTYTLTSYLATVLTPNSIKVQFHWEFGTMRTVQLYYGNPSPTTPLPGTFSLNGTGDTALTISGLSPAQTQFYSVHATSLSPPVVYNSTIGSATTPNVTMPDIAANAASITSITSTGATFGWTATLGSASTANVWGKIYLGTTLVYTFPTQFVMMSQIGSFGTYSGLSPFTSGYIYKVYIQDVNGIDSSISVSFDTPPTTLPPDLSLSLLTNGICDMYLSLEKTVYGPGTVIYTQWSDISSSGPFTDSLLACSNCVSGTQTLYIPGLDAETQYWFQDFGYAGPVLNRSYSNVVTDSTNSGGNPNIAIYSIYQGSPTELFVDFGGCGNGYLTQATVKVFYAGTSILVSSQTTSEGTCFFQDTVLMDSLPTCAPFDIQVIAQGIGIVSAIHQNVSTGCIGVEEHQTADFNVYPNPATNMITIAGIENMVDPMIRLISMDGRIVMTRAAVNQLLVDDIAPGMYVIIVLDNNQKTVFSGKVVIEH